MGSAHEFFVFSKALRHKNFVVLNSPHVILNLRICGRTECKRVRIASRLSILWQSHKCETLRAWSKSKTFQDLISWHWFSILIVRKTLNPLHVMVNPLHVILNLFQDLTYTTFVQKDPETRS